MLQKFFLDQTSFWLGFTAALIIWWLIRRARPIIEATQDALSQETGKYQNKFASSIENRYRKDMLAIVQENHLAAPLFSLTEIAIEPRLIAPPYPVIPEGPIPPEDSSNLVIPYMPDRPEMASCYGGETLSLAEAINSGRNLAIVGKPGIGKSFAINYLCAQLAQRHPDMGEARTEIPILIHASDLELPSSSGDYLNTLYKALANKVSAIVESQLPKFLKTIFKNNSTLLIIDGLDDLPDNSQKPIVDFLKALLGSYPEIRLVISLSTEDLSAIGPLNLFPIPMAAWQPKQAQEFLEKWENLWEAFIENEAWADNLPDITDPLILSNWMKKKNKLQNPLEITLRTWGLFAGDVLGPKLTDALDAYILRMTGHIKNATPAMEQLAIQMILASNPQITRRSAGKFVSKYEETVPTINTEILADENSNVIEDEDNPFIDSELRELLEGLDQEEEEEIVEEEVIVLPEKVKERKVKNTMRSSAVRRMLPELVSSQMMRPGAGNTIRFNHPIILGYLAGCGFAKREDTKKILATPQWAGKTSSLAFLAHKGDVNQLLPMILEQDEVDPINSGTEMMGDWILQSPITNSWVKQLLRIFTNLIKTEDYSIGYRARTLIALAKSDQPGVGKLFQQLLMEGSPSVKILGALGSGMIKDKSAIAELGKMLNNANITGYRAACMALVAIDTDRSMELVGRALLNANEEGRRAAAEALARHPREGYDFLREGSKMKDLTIRHAVVYGLSYIDEPWANELLNDMHLHDDQWVVRNAAANALEADLGDYSRIPPKVEEVSELPWLMSFAAEQGMGLSPGQAGWDMLGLAIREGNEDQKLGAMDILRIHPQKARSAISDIYKLSENAGREVKEAAYSTLWHLSAMGVDIGGYI